jgi:hypothetical protein
MRQLETLISSSMMILMMMMMMMTSYPDFDHSLHIFPLDPTTMRLVAPALLRL